jgi:isopentenyl diphosphate isomerase/L-lactate dehydrogenase-like FMN-dependent dehydrogenase
LPAPERLELSVLEDLADKLLPRGIFDYFAGGADDEQTVAANARAWSSVPLRPRVLRDEKVNKKTSNLRQ